MKKSCSEEETNKSRKETKLNLVKEKKRQENLRNLIYEVKTTRKF